MEKRETQPFTDAVIQAIVSQAEGSTPGDPAQTWALECAANLYARAFAAAKVTGERTSALSPPFLAHVARNLIRRGESLSLIEMSRGEPVFRQAGSWDVRGAWDEDSWFYRLDLFGPSGNITRFVESAAVIHFRYAYDPARPWHGIGPLGWSRETGSLMANLEKRLGEEAGGPVAHVLAIPQDGGDGGDDDPLAQLKSDLAGARGKTILTETTSSGWGEGMASAPRSDWKPQRLGAHPPDVLRGLRSDAGMAVLSACGIPVALVLDSDGTSQRESYRRWIMSVVEPLLNQVAEEFSRKLETSVSFDLSGIWAHDLAGRAAAFQKMIAGGMEIERAVAASGLVIGRWGGGVNDNKEWRAASPRAKGLIERARAHGMETLDAADWDHLVDSYLYINPSELDALIGKALAAKGTKYDHAGNTIE